VTIKILDLRHEQVNPFPAKKKSDGSTLITSKIVKGKTYERDPSSIDGIAIHQTACVFGPSSDIDRRNRRALGIPAHAVAFRDGTVVLPAPLSWYLYHGNDLNRHTLGLEIEGRYPGLPDDPRTPKREDEAWGGGATPLDESTVQSARAALTRLVEEGRSLGMPLKWVWAHRQANGQKPSDPGFGIWQRVVLDYAVPVLGLSTRPADVFRDGRPIPGAWDSGSIAPY
jgi:hypothetical protein